MISTLIAGVITLLGAVEGVTIDGYETIDEARKRGKIAKLPAIVVVYQGGPIQAKGQLGWTHNAQLRIQCGARHLRGGQELVAGALDLLEIALARLAGVTAPVSMPWVKEMTPVGIELVQVPEISGGMCQYDLLLEAKLYITPELLTDSLATIVATVAVATADVSDDVIEIETE